jgi:2-C-methyl-D-erythritol 2,4-cyclodiphosphate synthase
VRVGLGLDVHRLVPGRPLVLGGVHIPCDRGLEGHSDGDVLLHAVADALLGAAAAGDLGSEFGSDDPAWRGAASRGFVERALARVAEAGLRLANLDATLVAQEPRLAPHQPELRKRLAELLDVDPSRVSVKVTSTDRLGAIGRGEGIAAHVVVCLEPAPAGAGR